MMGSVLITGGSGFFGRGFAKYLLDNNLSDRVCIYSRDEHKHAEMREEFNNESRIRYFVGDVRDVTRLRRAMNDVDIVIHAAALKMIQTGFYDPIEMARTNVDGAINVIEAAMDARVKKVIALSTDKAYMPKSGYGHSKALAESIFLAANNMRGKEGPIFNVTRYGNVAGSTSSIIPKWRKILKFSDTVPVTNPDATRFWMTLKEAIELVIDTINSDKIGHLAVPRWLPAYRVGDLATAMNAKINIIGMESFEKIHESLDDGLSSDIARRMSIEELKERLNEIP